MSFLERYPDEVVALLRRLVAEEGPAIERAAARVADTIAADRLLHVFGTGGHSYMGAEELFFRAGGLVPVNAILDEGVSLGHGALRSMAVERTPGYAKAVLDVHQVGADDTLIIVNAYGVNAVTVDAAMEARSRGCVTIAVTSVALQRALPQGHPSRHPSGRDLCDEADIVVDCKVPMGDALVELPGLPQRIGASSTFGNAMALNLIAGRAVELLVARGIEPPLWQSANSPGGDAANAGHVRAYRQRIKKL